MANDANCFALAEAKLGVVKDVMPNAKSGLGNHSWGQVLAAASSLMEKFWKEGMASVGNGDILILMTVVGIVIVEMWGAWKQ